MKACPKCNAQVDDHAVFCPVCGAQFAAQANNNTNTNNYNPQGNYAPNGNPQYNYAPYPPQPAYDPFDHTSEFETQDISENKVVCMLIYLSGYIGILVALLLSGSSKYVGFHLRQALKLEVTTLLINLILVVGAVINIIPVLGWIVYGLAALAAGVFNILIFVARIICFVDICKGKAKEPKFVCNLKFFK